MKQTSTISALVFVSLAIGALLYANSPAQKGLEQNFNQWKNQFNIGQDYDASQNLYRMKIFEQNLQEINTHNSLLGRSYEMGVNQFTHLTPQQFKAQYLIQYEANKADQIVEEVQSAPTGPIINWVTYGAVSPVKNQGSCTASYAFSAVGAIEGVSVIYFKNQQQYSVQQVVDCSSGFGNNGCFNGRMDSTFNYVKGVGINSWASYPYVGFQQSCKTGSGFFKVNGSIPINFADCNTLANALTSRPISVVVDGQRMQSYVSGIFANCGTTLSLPLLLVGMTDSYWTLKNSWGAQWGEAGYIRIPRGNACGVCNAACYPSV